MLSQLNKQQLTLFPWTSWKFFSQLQVVGCGCLFGQSYWFFDGNQWLYKWIKTEIIDKQRINYIVFNDCIINTVVHYTLIININWIYLDPDNNLK